MTTFPKHETKSCARCKAGFECKSGSVLLCQCQTVVLNEEQLDYVNNRYEDCLCAKCLLALRKECNMASHQENLLKFCR